MDAHRMLLEWLNERDDDGEELSIKEPYPQEFMVDSPVLVGQHYWRRIVEVSDATCLVDMKLYAPVKVLDECCTEVCLLLNELNGRHTFGAFVLLADGRICYRIRSDFEGAAPTGRSIELMAIPAFSVCEEHADSVISVALGVRPAREVIRDISADSDELEKMPGALAERIH